MRRRRWFRNSRDPAFQGDGWRWSLSFVLHLARLDQMVLTPGQRFACRQERQRFLQQTIREEHHETP